MAQYILKSALVAEIERLISNGQVKLQESQECNDYESNVAWSEYIATCRKVLSLLDTLEVKEADLDFQMFAKEMDIVFALPSSETKNTEEEPLNWEYAIAKHFYSLRFKAQKGE